MSEPKKIYLITGSKPKYLEIKDFLAGIVELEMLKIDLPEIQEYDAKKIIERKLQSAINLHPDKELIVEDTSLHLNCLNGFPGPLIKWFEKTLGYQKIFDLCSSLGDCKAEAKVIIGYAHKGKIFYFEGSSFGTIVEPGYTAGFGWDLIFMPDGLDKRYSELTREEKNKISHRAKASKKFKDFLEKQQQQE